MDNFLPPPAPEFSLPDKHWAEVEKKKDQAESPAVVLDKPSGPLLQEIKEVVWNGTIATTEPSETETLLSKPLYEMASDYNQLVDFLVSRGGDMDEESLSAWNNIQGTVTEKLENCGRKIRELSGRAEQAKIESGRINDRAKALKNSADRLNEYTKAQMIVMDKKKSEGVSLNLTIADTAAKCEILDELVVPDAFCAVAVKLTAEQWAKVGPAIAAIIGDLPPNTRTVDKTAVIKEWKACQGAFQVRGTVVSKGTSLRIY